VLDARYGVPGRWTFVCCRDCDLVYLAETLVDPAQGYPSAYSQHRPAGRVRLVRRWSPTREVRAAFLALQGYEQPQRPMVPGPLARLALAVPQVRLRAGYGHLLMPRARPGGAVLDIGCGKGRFLTLMQMLGWRVHGIEPDEQSAAIARQSSGAQIDAELDEHLYPPESFDVITMNHVLEHVADPVPLLRQCFRVCRSGGLLGVAVPNWRALGHRLFRGHWYALDPPRHTVMYEPATLERMLEKGGFHVESVRTTSVREWATVWRNSWSFKTSHSSPRPLLVAWGAVTSVASLVAADAGEEVLAWARKP
jgi:2-polyprenyl-3-methyl-5-hydroxy-6-metoxy-1,4-benzoquinol methylase